MLCSYCENQAVYTFGGFGVFGSCEDHVGMNKGCAICGKELSSNYLCEEHDELFLLLQRKPSPID